MGELGKGGYMVVSVAAGRALLSNVTGFWFVQTSTNIKIQYSAQPAVVVWSRLPI